MTFAYFGTPHVGGTYAVYRQLRDGLINHGIRVKWMGLGSGARTAREDPRWMCERDDGIVVAPHTVDEEIQGKSLCEHLAAGDYSGVFVNVLAGRVETNVARYLDSKILRIMIVHSTTVATYAAAKTVKNFVHATIGVSPRVKNDLVHRGFPQGRTICIPNAVDLARFSNLKRASTRTPLRLISLGRIEDSSKGVFWLPQIMSHLDPAVAQLTVAGDGPDLPELKQRCVGLKDRIRFIGRVEMDDVPRVFAEHDIFIMPSRYEGFGLALAEAMTAGCVPICSRIRGVTDFLIEDGVNGALFPIGDCRKAASCIAAFLRDPALLRSVGQAAEARIGTTFSLKSIGQQYAKLIYAIASNPPSISTPLKFDKWAYPSGLRPALRSYLPASIKDLLRLLRERLNL